MPRVRVKTSSTSVSWGGAPSSPASCSPVSMRSSGPSVIHSHAREAPDVGEPSTERMLVADLSAANGADDRETAVDRTGDEVHQHVERALVGPVQIVDEEHDQAIAAEFIEPGVERGGNIGGTARRSRRDRRGSPTSSRRVASRTAARRARNGTVIVGERQAGSLENHGVGARVACRPSCTSAVLPTPASPVSSSVAATPACACGQEFADRGEFAGSTDEDRSVRLETRGHPSVSHSSRATVPINLRVSHADLRGRARCARGRTPRSVRP